MYELAELELYPQGWGANPLSAHLVEDIIWYARVQAEREREERERDVSSRQRFSLAVPCNFCWRTAAHYLSPDWLCDEHHKRAARVQARRRAVTAELVWPERGDDPGGAWTGELLARQRANVERSLAEKGVKAKGSFVGAGEWLVVPQGGEREACEELDPVDGGWKRTWWRGSTFHVQARKDAVEAMWSEITSAGRKRQGWRRPADPAALDRAAELARAGSSTKAAARAENVDRRTLGRHIKRHNGVGA